LINQAINQLVLRHEERRKMRKMRKMRMKKKKAAIVLFVSHDL
jgi:hypothetical protein